MKNKSLAEMCHERRKYLRSLRHIDFVTRYERLGRKRHFLERFGKLKMAKRIK